MSGTERPAVALLIETSNGYARGLLEGIIGYVRAHDAWSIWLPEQRRGESPPEWLERWRGHGIIARIETTETARAIARTGLPTVDVSAARPLPTVPWVETNDAAITRLAIEHLVERGFRRLGFVGEPAFKWSQFRRTEFEAIGAASGLETHVFESPHRRARDSEFQQEQQALGDWLVGLPKPLGVFASYDIKGQQVLDLCRERDLAVPEQIAVIGVDDDQLLCNLCTPPLSSVAPDTFRTGYVAAELLDRMLLGESIPPQAYLIEPKGVTTRRSTETLAIEDAHVAAALRLIRERARDGIDVSDLLKAVPVSRRVLETKFQRLVGRTPHEEIVRVRLQRVQQLLLQTQLSIGEIAQRSGFEHPEYLAVVFRRELGCTPREFREQQRPPGRPETVLPAGLSGSGPAAELEVSPKKPARRGRRTRPPSANQ